MFCNFCKFELSNDRNKQKNGSQILFKIDGELSGHAHRKCFMKAKNRFEKQTASDILDENVYMVFVIESQINDLEKQIDSTDRLISGMDWERDYYTNPKTSGTWHDCPGVVNPKRNAFFEEINRLRRYLGMAAIVEWYEKDRAQIEIESLFQKIYEDARIETHTCEEKIKNHKITFLEICNECEVLVKSATKYAS
jgi:hypothetical protein